MPGRTVFLPGDFTGWVAASEAVVLGTVTELAPGFDATGRANTLLALENVDHLYPPRSYSQIVKYVILPYAQFVAGGTVFCRPWAQSQEFYPSVGDRLLIAADAPADNQGLAMTVQSMSRVVLVKDDDSLVTYGQSDFYPVDFAVDFPEGLDDARARAWRIWENGLVDFATRLGSAEFTQVWRQQKEERAVLKSRGCDIDNGEFRSAASGWSFSAQCPNSDEAPGNEPRDQSR